MLFNVDTSCLQVPPPSYRPAICGQGNIFTPVCHSVHMGGGLPQCTLGYHPLPWRHPPLPGRPPSKETPSPGPHPRGEIEGDQIQAHTQGGNWGGSDPGPHPRGKLRGIRSPPPRSRLRHTVNERPVGILLECIHVLFNVDTSCLQVPPPSIDFVLPSPTIGLPLQSVVGSALDAALQGEGYSAEPGGKTWV